MNLPDQRKPYFDFFKNFESPLLNICWEIEVNDFTGKCKIAEISSYHFLVHSLTKACLNVEAFLWRTDREHQPIRVDSLTPSFTVMKPDGNFNFCTLPFEDNIFDFNHSCELAKKASQESQGLSSDEEGRVDYIFITSIPWMRFTSIQHPVHNLKRVNVPSFAFGKFIKENGKIKIPFAVQGHHGFIDGIHMHQLERELIKNLNSDF
ncbi:MAG: hypothetical protein K2P81_17055 [Bacteriovoracaceae bacterium]|nr:hypothetical protein [Bacteriovoracaceae bacterium]